MRSRAAVLAVVLVGCASAPEPPQDAPRVATTSTIASPLAPIVASSSPSSAAPPEPSPPSSELPLELSVEQLQALDAELHSRRVFRHLTLGRMPVRERNTWMLDEARASLTLACERTADGHAESGSPVPEGWFVVSSARFAASDVPAGKTWAASYRRVESTQARNAGRTLCTELGEELSLDCKPATVSLRGPTAFVPAETRREEPVRWKPGNVRVVNGTGCTVESGAIVLSFYRSEYVGSSEPKQPMIFFANDRKLPVERLVHSDALQYQGFRESTLTAFDGSLPEYLRKR